VDDLGETRNLGETSYILLPQFRKLMGIPEDAYPVFKKLNTRVIKEPLDSKPTTCESRALLYMALRDFSNSDFYGNQL